MREKLNFAPSYVNLRVYVSKERLDGANILITKSGVALFTRMLEPGLRAQEFTCLGRRMKRIHLRYCV